MKERTRFMMAAGLYLMAYGFSLDSFHAGACLVAALATALSLAKVTKRFFVSQWCALAIEISIVSFVEHAAGVFAMSRSLWLVSVLGAIGARAWVSTRFLIVERAAAPTALAMAGFLSIALAVPVMQWTRVQMIVLICVIFQPLLRPCLMFFAARKIVQAEKAWSRLA